MKQFKTYRLAVATIVLILLGGSSMQAQSKAFKNFMDKHSAREGVTTMLMSGSMLSSISADESMDSDNIDSLWIISISENDSVFDKDLEKLLQDNYKNSMVINESGNRAEFHTISKNNKIVELLVVVREGTNTVILLITGSNLDIEQITKLSL